MSHRAEPSPGNPLIKVFFALWPTAAERDQLAAWRAPLQQLCGGRAIRSETLHNTLVFVGQVAQADLEALRLAALAVDVEAFEMCMDGAHCWNHNHIVYAAPSHVPQPLRQLVDALELNLDRRGLEFDRRAYRPHITLLRNAHCPDKPLLAMPQVVWRCRDFVLVQSVQDGAGAHYRELARFPLRAA
jgi:RNA 2',3'-cyclic 3'-phosphodiesterase